MILEFLVIIIIQQNISAVTMYVNEMSVNKVLWMHILVTGHIPTPHSLADDSGVNIGLECYSTTLWY